MGELAAACAAHTSGIAASTTSGLQHWQYWLNESCDGNLPACGTSDVEQQLAASLDPSLQCAVRYSQPSESGWRTAGWDLQKSLCSQWPAAVRSQSHTKPATCKHTLLCCYVACCAVSSCPGKPSWVSPRLTAFNAVRHNHTRTTTPALTCEKAP
jgi:hypothetical protein